VSPPFSLTPPPEAAQEKGDLNSYVLCLLHDFAEKTSVLKNSCMVESKGIRSTQKDTEFWRGEPETPPDGLLVMLHAHGLQKSVGHPLGQGEGTVSSGGEPTYSHALVDVETVANQKRQACWTSFLTADDR